MSEQEQERVVKATEFKAEASPRNRGVRRHPSDA